jgi:aspartate/methionine/tyrosine aminotransferase
VSQWRRRYEDGWAHDLDALAGLIRLATRMLYLNQPHNPTGTLMARHDFERVIGLARAHGLILFSDEVYRELEHDPAQRLPPACGEYELAVSLGSISKSYGLPGLRIGWIATRDRGMREAVATMKDYTTICASAPSEFLTALALRHRQVLLDRNLAIVQRNLPLLDGFFARHAETFDWVRPTASPIGFPRVTGVGDLPISPKPGDAAPGGHFRRRCPGRRKFCQARCVNATTVRARLVLITDWRHDDRR